MESIVVIMKELEELLVRHEGLRLKPYTDTVGKVTIGVGRNLDDVGISKDEALLLLQSDIERVVIQANANFPWYPKLDNVRKDVILSMLFNMGLSRFSGFKNTIGLIASGKYQQASEEMLKSTWAKQVGQRSIELSHMMATGVR